MSAEDEVDEFKYKEVQEMLESLYAPRKVPEFEVTKTTIEILHQIATKLKKQKKIDEDQVKYYNQLAKMYASNTKQLTDSLQTAGISLGDFPKDCSEAAKALAESACILNLQEPKATNFLLAMNDLTREQHKISQERTKLLQEQAKLTRKLNSLMKKVDDLEKTVSATKGRQEAQSAEAVKRKSQTKFLHSKTEEYKKKVLELQKTVGASGYEPSINHSELVKEHEEIKKLEEKLNDLSLKLDAYHNLPPNENLARLKVEETRQELFTLEQELKSRIESKASDT